MKIEQTTLTAIRRLNLLRAFIAGLECYPSMVHEVGGMRDDIDYMLQKFEEMYTATDDDFKEIRSLRIWACQVDMACRGSVRGTRFRR